MLVNCIVTRQHFLPHWELITTEIFNFAKLKWGITGKVTCRRCRYFWTSIRVHLRANYGQLKNRRSLNTRWTFSKFWQRLEKVYRYKICNAQREIV